MPDSEVSNLSVEPSVFRRLTSEQKERLTELLDHYLSALDGGVPPQRDELLQAHPDLAEPLQSYFDSLDALHGVAAGFDNSSQRAASSVESCEDDEKRLGDFRLLREVGRGGMGVVYEAQQISLGRRVALKVLPFAAVLDAKQIARFKNEAQAAAQLHHPGIVPVFAVGSERGVHYYAMQFIDGQPLDRAIAELRLAADESATDATRDAADTTIASSPAQRAAATSATGSSLLAAGSTNRREYSRTVLRLGIQAAQALHAAHEYGVVHRDVKPSNLLLDGDGKLWVTDFGLARCRTDTSLTRTGDVVGTMRYMSPEQAAGQTALVDQRSDIYSLGVTLYEMLALQPAFLGDDGAAVLRRIAEQEPKRLRQLHPKMPADLETVIHKAMAKSRDERYATAAQFADDMQRVLDGKPTVARPPTIGDRLGKWARRHRRLVAAAAVVCLCGMIGMAVSTALIMREKVNTQQNYERAEMYRRDAQGAVDRFGARLAERLADVPGADRVREELLQDTLQYYREFVEQAQDDPALKADLAMTYSKIATLTENLGSVEQAVAAHRQALALFERLVADDVDDVEYQRHLALCQNNLALTLVRAGRTEQAAQAYQEALRLQRKLVKTASDGQRYLTDLALSHSNLGLLRSETGQVDSAEQSFGEAIRIHGGLLKNDPENADHLRNLAAALNNLSALYVERRPEEATELCERALRFQEQAAALHPGQLKYRNDVALTHNNLGALHSRGEQLAEAAESYGTAIAIQRELVQAAPAQKSTRRNLAVSFNNLGLVRSKLGQMSVAERSFEQALALHESLVAQDPHDLDLRSSLGGVYNNLGIVQEELQRDAAAAASYRLAVEHQQFAYANAPDVSRYRLFLSKHFFNYGRVLRRLDRAEDAATVALARRELWPDDPRRLFTVGEELALAAELAAGGGDDMAAAQTASHAVETLQQAIALGFELPAGLGDSDSFTALRNHPGFESLFEK